MGRPQQPEGWTPTLGYSDLLQTRHAPLESAEQLSLQVVEDKEFGNVLQVVDEYGVFAGYDVSDEQIEQEAAKQGLEGREFNIFWMATTRFHNELFHKGKFERRNDRSDDSGVVEPGVIRDEYSDEGIADEMASRTPRYWTSDKGGER